MTKLELMKLKAELASVISARLNLELKIEESLENIARLQEHILVQEKKEKELNEKLAPQAEQEY